MDDVVSQLLSYKTLILAVGVVIGTFFIRRIVETAVPSAQKKAPENAPTMTYLTLFSIWWNQVILYAIPVLLGVIISVCVGELAPSGITKTGALAVYGGVVGWFSSFMYKVLRKTVKAKVGVDLPGSTTPPPPGDESVTSDDLP